MRQDKTTKSLIKIHKIGSFCSTSVTFGVTCKKFMCFANVMIYLLIRTKLIL